MEVERNEAALDRLNASTKTIREIHAFCAAWENRTMRSSTKSPTGPRWLKLTYGMVGQFAMIGYLLILSQVQWNSSFWVSLHTWLVWIVAGLCLVYMVAAALVEVIYGWRDFRETASAFSPTDSDETEADLLHSAKLARYDPLVIQYVTSWLELRAKRIDNQMSWLKGCAAMGAASLGAIFLEKSPLRELLIEALSLPGVITAQAMLFTALLGILIGMAAIGKRSANSANRALRVRRIQAERGVILALVGESATTSDGALPTALQPPNTSDSKLPQI